MTSFLIGLIYFKIKKKIYPYENYFFSPISTNYLTNNLYENKFKNIIHLSGDISISFYEFAIEIAKKFNFSESLIIPKKIDENNFLFQNSSKMLELDYTKKQFNIKPQTLSSVINDFYDEYIKNEN